MAKSRRRTNYRKKGKHSKMRKTRKTHKMGKRSKRRYRGGDGVCVRQSDFDAKVTELGSVDLARDFFKNLKYPDTGNYKYSRNPQDPDYLEMCMDNNT